MTKPENEKFVTTTVCELKHKEVTEVKGDVKELRDCVQRKFAVLNRWMYALMGALIANLAIRLITGG